MKNNYLLTESLISSVAIYLILKKLMMKWEDWDAYKLGIIDKDGKKLKTPITSKERESWDLLTKFCWNLKRLSYKFIGKSKFATYFSSAYLLSDSIIPYIKYNKSSVESLLTEMTFQKQKCIYDATKNISINESVNEDNIELMLHKYINLIEQKIDLDEMKNCLFTEDVAPASSPTVASDIAQVSQYLGVTKRKQKKKKLKVIELETK